MMIGMRLSFVEQCPATVGVDSGRIDHDSGGEGVNVGELLLCNNNKSWGQYE